MSEALVADGGTVSLVARSWELCVGDKLVAIQRFLPDIVQFVRSDSSHQIPSLIRALFGTFCYRVEMIESIMLLKELTQSISLSHYFAFVPLWLIITALLSLPLICLATWSIYTLTLHPLASFPGPKLAAISPLLYSRMAMSGKLPHRIQELHRRYGRVVRLSPSELSFASAAAYRDIYNQTGDATFVKSKFYKVSNFTASDIIGESDVTIHANMRKLWAHGFSAKALISHEELEQRYTDLFIRQLRAHENAERGVNVVDWFNYMTFDIIGELVFGESFGALENGTSQFWISCILDNMASGLLIDLIRRLGFYIGFKKLLGYLPFEKIEAMNRHTQITRDMAALYVSPTPSFEAKLTLLAPFKPSCSFQG